MLNSTLCRSREFILTLCISHIWPLLEFTSCFWNLEYMSHMKLLENVQRRWTKRIDSFGNLTYSQRLKDLYLFLVEGRLLRTDVMKCWKIFHSKRGICAEDIFVLNFVAIDLKSFMNVFQWIVGGDYLLWELQWNSLPIDVVLETLGNF